MNRIEWLKNITPKEFAMLGVHDMAYIKRVVANDEAGFAIYAADGTQVAMLPNRETALATVLQNDMEPVSVH